MRRFLLVLSVLGVLLVAAPPAAQAASTVEEVVAGLRVDQVFLDPGAAVPIDEQQTRDAVSRARVQVYVAVVPASVSTRVGGDAELVRRLGVALRDSSAVVLLLTDAPSAYADNSTALGARGVNAGSVVRSVPRGQFDAAGVAGFVQGFVDGVDAQSVGRSPSSGLFSGLVPFLLIVGVGLGAFSLIGSRRRANQSKAALQVSLEDARADVESLYGRLGSDVQLLSVGDDALAEQALADAAERYNATGALLSGADTPGEFAAARRTAVEGLAAARVVRQRLGLDPGPDIWLTPGAGPQLEQPARIAVGNDEFDGAPAYEPGRSHYYEGGYYGTQQVPGGWYATPFWQKMLLTSVLGGGLGYGRRRSGVFVGGLGGLGGGRRGGRGGGW